ncbi:hypothetical protein ACFX1Z_024350 [Malus domestica]
MAGKVNPIPNSIKKLWDKWNLRGFILLSLTLQTLLILFAPARKRTPNMGIMFIVWSSYLLADWAANFAIGLISNSQGDHAGDDYPGDLLAFWAPFLLLHLGGPDTITAFALEDNTLWLRHFLGLIFQVAAAVYVFIRSFPKNKLWLPTGLLFLAGIIKYAERTRSLYSASLDNFKEAMIKEADPGPNYAKLMEEYSSRKDSQLPTHIELTAERSKESRTVTYVIGKDELDSDIAVVKHAHYFYQIFKGLIVDLIFSFHERQESRAVFLERTPKEAFKLIAVELNFMYEALFTKAAVVHTKPAYILRVVSFSAIVIALVFFYRLEKEGLHSFDVRITYTLLFGAISLDSIAIVMLTFSDWTIAALNKFWQNSGLAKTIFGKYLDFKRSWWWPKAKTRNEGGQIPKTKATKCLEWIRRILFRRWYESVSTFNFIHYSLKEKRKISPTWYDYFGIGYIKVITLFGLKDLHDKLIYRTKKPLAEELWVFIFEQLISKSMLADDPETARKIGAARGDWVLEGSDWDSKVITKLLSYVVDVEYDKSILLWHIATELCFNDDKSEAEGEAGPEVSDETKKSKEHSKTISDYMLYLLVMQPSMMSSITGIGQIRFRDTCAEAKKFFSRRDLGSGQVKEACEKLLEVNTDVEPVAVKGDRSKSVLFDACILAKELRKLKDKKWELMSEVWVEIMSYTASHCRANDHAQLLSKGGELVTFVWLLMAHFGIGEQFQINEGHARAKLIVGK